MPPARDAADRSSDIQLADVADLVRLGNDLDSKWASGDRQAFATAISEHLRVRDKAGKLVPLVANAMQSNYLQRCGKRNIVLKARQLGMTTWVAGRFFFQTITHPGTLTVQVAHDQDSAEEIFRIVHRFLENLPEAARRGALMTSRANVRQLVFPRIEAITAREIADEDKFRDGLSKVVDGVVQCLNASVWAKSKA